jgi:hypothetical protein
MSWTKSLLIAGGLLAAASGVAIAQEARDPVRRKPSPLRVVAPERKVELAALQAAGQRPAPPVKEVPLGPSITNRARLEAVFDGRAVVSVAVSASDVARMLGVREVHSADDVGDGVVYAGRLYNSFFLLDPERERLLLPLVGQELDLELKRGLDDIAFLASWRSP